MTVNLTEPLGVYITLDSEKSLDSPKSIILIFVMSSLFFNKKFSGLISLCTAHETLRTLVLPMGDLVLMQVFNCWKSLLHDQGCFLLCQSLPLKNVVEQLTSFTIPIGQKNIRKNCKCELDLNVSMESDEDYSVTKKQIDCHSQISWSLMIFGWSYRD